MIPSNIPSSPDVNVPLLRKVMEHVTAHPEEYDQRWWAVQHSCGTTHCIGGWAVALSGQEFEWKTRGYAQALDGSVAIGRLSHGGSTVLAAEKALGLTWDDANALFAADNTLSEVWEHVERITGGEITRPPVEDA